MTMKNIWSWKVFGIAFVVFAIANGIGWYPVFFNLPQNETWNMVSFGISLPAFVTLSRCLDQACGHDFWFDPAFYVLAFVVSPMMYAAVVTLVSAAIRKVRNRLK